MAIDGDLDLLRRRVLNVVGHELRTPVAAITGLAAELQTCADDGRRQEVVDALVRLTGRLDRLVGDLLLASSISTLVPVEDPQPVELVGLARARWSGGPAGFEGSATALTRPASAERVLDALLDNATVHGEPPITVRGSHEGDRAVLEVESAGPEVAPGDLELAGEAFFRGERAVTSAAGLGLGLAVARTLLAADGGQLALRPRSGGGVVARLELPVAPA